MLLPPHPWVNPVTQLHGRFYTSQNKTHGLHGFSKINTISISDFSLYCVERTYLSLSLPMKSAAVFSPPAHF
jgi:hypothetical protein